VKLPQQPVVVAADGKLFHDPACTHIHGKPERMSALDAVRQGYTPCTRCMRSALKR
jgi:methylphosphotriester-DNA--protein-cysteine methyltransferase